MKSKPGQNHTDRTQPQSRKPCRLLRRRLFEQSPVPDSGLFTGITSRVRIDLETNWVQKHIASCPRCQHRFAALNRVNLALSLLKSQPHTKDLLPRANTQTVDVLQHKLRQTQKAYSLKTAFPNLTVPERIRLLHHSFAHVAACIAILVLSKIGVFSTIKHSLNTGQKTVAELYASHLDADTADEVFPRV